MDEITIIPPIDHHFNNQCTYANTKANGVGALCFLNAPASLQAKQAAESHLSDRQCLHK